MKVSWLGRMLLANMALTASMPSTGSGRVQGLKITLLSTMLADSGTHGVWGYAALVEVDGRRILFDTGAHEDVVQRNCRALGINLATVPELVLSHWHGDHVGGLIALRRAVMKETPAALVRAHVGEGIFLSRPESNSGTEQNPMLRLRTEFAAAGGAFVIHDRPLELYPGVWLTGPVPRRHPERNWSGSDLVRLPSGLEEDDVPEDLSLVIDTSAGLVVLTGCGHAGVINIVEHARGFLRPARVHALIGGIHLFRAGAPVLDWTAEKLRAFGVDHLLGAHCTGIETVYRLRAALGARFELGRGLDPGVIAR